MHPLVRGATAAAVLTALGSLDRGPAAPVPVATPAPGGERPTPCAPGTLPEGPVCLRIPGEAERAAARPGDDLTRGAPLRGEASPDRIPRRPERPADPAAYVYPVGDGASADGGAGWTPRLLTTGADLPGIKLAVRPGEIVRALALEHQVGPAEVVYAGDLYGPTVVTSHVVEEGGRKRTILLYAGGLDHAAPGVVPGARLDAGGELGAARTGLGAGLIDVYVEARELRDGAKLEGADAKRLRDTALAVPTDVRNVLPLR